ncbi:MAG: DUF222 domain-containing protein [Woeseiaceae bacterium]|nr:DUF222 domain-containing protein [Woeseiaceae bacterium]
MSATARLAATQSPTRPTAVADLGTEITELCTYIFAATYRLLVLIREFDEAEGWAQPGLCSCAHWLNFKCGIGMNAAREKLRVAHALKELPKISAAFEQGELSYSKVRAMTRIADQENEDYLLMIARHGTAYHMEKLVQKYRRAKRSQDVTHANQQHKDRYVDYHYDEDGCLVVSGRLPAEQGALVVKALEKALRADVSAETSDQVCEEKAVTKDRQDSIAARCSDALCEFAETYLNADSKPGSTADRYQVVVHVSAETPTPDCEGESHIEEGPHVSAETSRRVLCDCSTVRVTEGEVGEPLSIGRKTRSIPPAIRRALRYRDKGCRFPGCTHTRIVDGHHIQHWADGGATSLDNLVQLCRFHHRLVHEGGYGCERPAGRGIVFTAPDRRQLPEYSELRGRDTFSTKSVERYLSAMEVATKSCVPEYYAGDRMDWDLAVAALF